MKLKLTKLQRHTAYILMLEEFNKEEHLNKHNGTSWFCYLIWELFGIEDSGFGGDDYVSIRYNRKHFKELNKLFPEHLSISHWDFETRSYILKKCIEETA